MSWQRERAFYLPADGNIRLGFDPKLPPCKETKANPDVKAYSSTFSCMTGQSFSSSSLAAKKSAENGLKYT